MRPFGVTRITMMVACEKCNARLFFSYSNEADMKPAYRYERFRTFNSLDLDGQYYVGSAMIPKRFAKRALHRVQRRKQRETLNNLHP